MFYQVVQVRDEIVGEIVYRLSFVQIPAVCKINRKAVVENVAVDFQ